MKVGDAEESRRLGGIATGVTQAQFRACWNLFMAGNGKGNCG